MYQWPRPRPGQLKRERTPPDTPDDDTDAKEVVRSIYDHTDPDLGLEFVTRLGAD